MKGNIMHPCKKCFLHHEPKDNDLCLHCEARIQACRGIYIEPPQQQDVAQHIRGKVRGKTSRKFAEVTERLGYTNERVMWNDLYWSKNLSYAKIRELVIAKTLILVSNSMIGDRFIKLGVSRRKPGGQKLPFRDRQSFSASVSRRIG